MGLIPGWESITSTNWWASFYFWASIVALSLLGIFEVISHRYTQRHEELSAIQQKETQKRHDFEIGKLHLKASQAELETAKLRAQLEDRSLTKEQFDELQTLRGKVSTVTVTTLMGDSETKLFGQQITDALKFAGIIVKIGDPKLSLPWSGVSVILPGTATKINEDPVVSIFSKSGIASFAGHAKQTPLGDISLDTPMIFVGRKDVSPPHPSGASITEWHDNVTATGTIKRN
jgi:hypothetical protein